ncbi:zinc finger protein 189-like [Penaeus indicus]|uniref:zinc finger protein 189-like n=1 Tax=Penaeus indicus TaxID=29960 RepID=UPI00300CCE35
MSLHLLSALGDTHSISGITLGVHFWPCHCWTQLLGVAGSTNDTVGFEITNLYVLELDSLSEYSEKVIMYISAKDRRSKVVYIGSSTSAVKSKDVSAISRTDDQASSSMSDESDLANFQLLEIKEGETGECIVLVDSREREDVLYINSNSCSISCQTDPPCLLQCSYNPLCSIPMFFCALPFPGEATTQCTIPVKVDVGVGTNAAHHSCSDSSKRIEKKNYKSDSPGMPVRQGCEVQNLKTTADGDTLKTQRSPSKAAVVEVWNKEAVRIVSEEKGSECSEESCKKQDTASSCVKSLEILQIKGKRGRKKKIVAEESVESKEVKIKAFKANTTEEKISRRRRKKKRDADFEYDLSDSEDGAKIKLEVDDDDTDKDWMVMKEVALVEEEKSLINELILQEESSASEQGLRVPAVKKEGSDESVYYNSLIDAVAMEYGVSSDDSEEGEEEWHDDDSDKMGDEEITSHNSQVLRVGITDLVPEKAKDFSKQNKKHLEKSRERYHREKVVNKEGKVSFKCLKCNEEFDMRTQLNEHRKVHTRKIRIYECNHCDKVFNDARKYYSHLAFHDRLFECRSCGRRFSLLGNLKKHITIHQGAPDQVCDVCGFQFLTPDQLKLHQEAQHSGDHIRTYTCKCIHCGKEYVREEAFHQHINKGPYICSICNESLGCEFQLQKHVRYQHNQCVCEYCGKSFKKNSLIHHIKLVHKEGKVQCPHCPKKFTYRCKMLAHIDANHSIEKKYKCNHCSYTARTVNTLNLHRRRCHMDPNKLRNYVCKICGRKFFLPSKLTLHYRTHTGEKPFKCQTCGKGFAAKYNMMEHERCVHGERVQLKHPDGSTTVRVVKHRRAPRAPGRRCDLCGVDFPSSSAILQHMSEIHGAEASADDSLANVRANIKVEGQSEEANREKCMVVDSQYEVMAGSEDDIILSSSSGMVSIRADAIPEYATHVEIDGIEYQVVRQ